MPQSLSSPIASRSKRFWLFGTIGLQIGNFKPFLRTIENCLDVLHQSILVGFQSGVLLDGGLKKEFDVTGLAEIEISFLLEALDCFFQLVVFCLQSGRASSRIQKSTCRGAADGGGTSPSSG